MQVKLLRIANFRMLREVALTDLKGLNIFIGPNGTGKSTVLHVLSQLLRGGSFNVTGNDCFRSAPGGLIVIEGSIVLEREDVERVLAQVAISTGLPDPPEGMAERFDFLTDHETRLQYDVRAPRLVPAAASAARVIATEDTGLREAVVRNMPERDSWRDPIGLSRGNFANAFSGAFEAQLRDQSMTLLTGRTVPSVFVGGRAIQISPGTIGQWMLQARLADNPDLASYEEALRRFLPHIESIQTNPSPAERGQFDLGVAERNMPGSTPAAQWSSGTAHLALILAGLAALPKGSIMIVEEPELSLHPRAIWDLMDEIRRAASERRIQFFLTTHSELVAEGVEPETEDHTLWRFSRNEDGSAEPIRCTTDKEVVEAIDSLKVKPA